MRIRWMIAAVGALALALLTMAVPLEWPCSTRRGDGRPAAPPVPPTPSRPTSTSR